MNDISIAEELKILTSNSVQVIGLEEVLRFTRHIKKRPLRVKLGIDPTSPDIHLGFVVLLRKLRQFQDLGHEVDLVIGDFTAEIGDPSGKSKARPILSSEEIEKNADTYLHQVFLFLDKEKTTVHRNSEWLSVMSAQSLILHLSQFTLAQMIERDDFAARYRDGVPVHLHEFVYPVAQALDSCHLCSDVELGGSDQLFNVMAGRSLMQKQGMASQAILLMPLLVGLDGKSKMSKSQGNYIGVTDAPEDMYGKVMSIPDPLILPWMRLLTDIPEHEILEIDTDIASGKLNPMLAKKQLAWGIVCQCHDRRLADWAQTTFLSVVGRGEQPEEIRTVTIDLNEIPLVVLLKETGLASSFSEATRHIEQRGVRLNGEIQLDKSLIIPVTDGDVLSFGKRSFVKIAKGDV